MEFIFLLNILNVQNYFRNNFKMISSTHDKIHTYIFIFLFIHLYFPAENYLDPIVK